MIELLGVVFGVVATWDFVALGLPVGCTIFFVVLLWWLKRLQSDCIECAAALETLAHRLHENPRSTRRFPLHMRTPSGTALSNALNAVLLRTEALHWEVHTGGTGRVLKSVLWSPSSETHSLPEVCRTLLEANHDAFRATSAFVIPQHRPGSLEQAAALFGVPAGHDARAVLSTVIECAARGKVTEGPRIIDCMQFDSVTLNLQYLGIRFLVAAPLEDCALVLGYPAHSPPLTVEQARAEQLAALISKEWGFLQHRATSYSAASYSAASHLGTPSQEELPAHHEDTARCLAHLSHDMRSPLNNIRAILNLFRVQTADCEHEELTAVALSNCQTLGEIIDSVLEYTRFQAGQLDTSPSSFRLHELVEEVVTDYEVSARLKGLSLRVEESASRIVLSADRKQIKRVLSNVVSNAVKYTSFGSVTVRTVHKGDSKCCVEIEDTGIGMSHDQLASLFVPFYRAHAQQGGKEAEGFGLGLALSRILIEQNGGSIEVSSKEGMGSCFRVHFSVSAVQPLRPVISGPSERSELPSTHHLLLVDDEPECAQTLARCLRMQGYTVSEAYTIHDAISILNFECPSLVLSDATMPGGGAEQLLKKCALYSVPAIILTGDDDRSRQARLLALGASDIVVKPADIEQLKTAIESAATCSDKMKKTA